MNDVRRGVDERKVTVLVLFDFSKAFDTVSHALLLDKLPSLGLSASAIKWLRSYLTGRSQAVRGDHGLSPFLFTNSGVPQGSILGPLLFSIFINDIGSCIWEAQYLLYADDLQIYLSCDPAELDVCFQRLNADIARIQRWATANRLQLNVGKTKAIVFGARRLINAIDITSTGLLGSPEASIEVLSSVRNLGVMMDSKLTFDDHVHLIIRKANSAFYRLYGLRNYTDAPLRKLLVNAVILPLIQYCLAALQGIALVRDLKLQRLINRAVRFVTGLPRDSHISAARRDLGWLTVAGYRTNATATLLYRVLSTGCPEYLADLLTTYSSSRPRRGALAIQALAVPNFRTDTYRAAFAVAGPETWDTIPTEIRDLPTIGAFKTQLKRWIAASETPLA